MPAPELMVCQYQAGGSEWAWPSLGIQQLGIEEHQVLYYIILLEYRLLFDIIITAPGILFYYHNTDYYLTLSLQVAGTGVPDTDNIIMLVIIFPHFIEFLQALTDR